jgi:hypothetical protein
MVIECTDEDVADEVQGVLLQYGVRSSRQGPFISPTPDPTVHVLSVGNVPSEKDADVRRDLQRIAGAEIAP